MREMERISGLNPVLLPGDATPHGRNRGFTGMRCLRLSRTPRRQATVPNQLELGLMHPDSALIVLVF
jgi:hypothetical protein